jgi:cap1 methyltransferase
MNRAAIKLANIDAVHHISNHVFTFIDKTSPSPFSFCDVAAGPGGFTQYLQYRFPNSIGYGMTLKHQTLDWNTKSLDMSRFSPFYGPDNTGNLYTNWNHFIDFVLAEQPNGVDLVTADGGFDLEEGDKTLLHKQEFLSSRLLLTQSLIGIACTKLNGNFVLKTFDTVTSISAHVLFILSLCFNRIIIFKPISSRPANAESYLLCIGRKPDIQQYYQLLSDAANLYTDDLFLSTLFSDDLPASFTNWLYSSNTRSLDRQLSSAQHILLYINGQSPTIPSYDTRKFLLMWNLPDTPPNPRYTFIKV